MADIEDKNIPEIKNTTITLLQSTKDRLDELKMVPSETYDHLLSRVVDILRGGSENDGRRIK
jgi:hypothetical protein